MWPQSIMALIFGNDAMATRSHAYLGELVLIYCYRGLMVIFFLKPPPFLSYVMFQNDAALYHKKYAEYIF